MKDILRRAAEIILEPNAWTKGEYARDSEGEPLWSAADARACTWCAAGAIYKAHHEFIGEDLTDTDSWPLALTKLANIVSDSGPRHPANRIALLNDDPETEKETMVFALLLAAEVSR